MNEYYYEHFMNTFMNTFLRDMNTMNTFWLFNPLTIKNRYYTKYTTLSGRVRVYIKSLHCVHQQSQSVHDCVHKVFIRLFMEVF